ncbi:MAG TPA: 2-oxoglutarate dehydrogenase E1 component [Candidatus Eisenbacteria bacterium]|jgi:2-oxoglutarate dehydrogenase E1 component|nr:2-oxoglutarate dehydrogenase E1 component [Candidatus Eisenbacteria bacterium]
MAQRTTLVADRPTKSAKATAKKAGQNGEDRERIFESFRRWGYLQADLDPLGLLKPLKYAELDDLTGSGADEAREIYCGTIGAEFMHLPEPERRQWIAERLESKAPDLDQNKILERLVRADLFEQVLQARYLGTKRFSLEGVTALIPLLDSILNTAGQSGAIDSVIAMSHRGRLNVMVHAACKPPHEVVSGFEDVDPRSVLGAGDVKYHVGATGTYVTTGGQSINIHIVSNPSHLEAVDPVAMGRARAKQTRHGADGPIVDRSRESLNKVWTIVMHGDAAFAGQGIWAETLNLADLKAYTVGGTVHIVVNNLIGFTTPPVQEHSARFASDIAKRQSVPIFHVNAEDPDAVVRVGHLAAEYRAKFGSDVVVDIIGYRRHGHSEVDDPTITQPLTYDRIKNHPPLWKTYAEHTEIDASAISEAVRKEYEEEQTKAKNLKKQPHLRHLPGYWDPYIHGKYDPQYEVDTGLSREKLAGLTDGIVRVPDGFHLHPKLAKLLEQRAEMGHGKRAIDYGFAEALALGSLVLEGTPIRLTGQDSQRGTFNQRHAVLIDTETEHNYLTLSHLSRQQAFCEIHNSPLSEAACVGFEYGFSRDYPEALVMWEAQFGDFVNGAQVIIDQFISASEDKWNLPTGLVLLLPHGHEGQGPEHSSARIERFLQLAAEDNLQICQPSNAAQYFHMLRRQARRQWRKPLIVFTPKSMLRHPEASSGIEALTAPRFLPLVPDSEVQDASRILIASGKVGHDLRAERRKRKDTSTAIFFLDQLYPLPRPEITAAIEAHPNAREIIWVQEEPANMGALSYVLPRLQRLAQEKGLKVRSVKRSASASPATGSAKAHELEQKTLISLAFTTTAATTK